MLLRSSLIQAVQNRLRSLDLFSLQFRLTVGAVLISALGIGGMAGWMSWRMQSILLDGHKQMTMSLAERFEQDVELYREMMTVPESIQKVVDLRSTGNLAMWVKADDGQVVAQSDTLSMGSWQANGLTAGLLALPPVSTRNIYPIRDRYFVICVKGLTVDGQRVGNLYVVADVTEDQKSLLAMIRSLSATSVVVILILMGAIWVYVRQSLRPICRLNTLVADVSADNLADTRLKLDRAPTEVQELAQTFDMMLSRLSTAWEHQRRFVSDVSHELRTPLTLVHGYLQSTLRRPQNLTDPQREGLEIASSEAERTIRMLQDLLDLARADSGYLRFNFEPIDLKALILEVVAMSDHVCDRVQADIATGSIEVRGDRKRLTQVLLNLIDNAVNYSAADQPITVRLAREGEWAVIQVCDRGRGIPLADQTAIFEPFYRVDEDRSRHTGGTGLGLSIVKTLVEGMRGKVKVHSKLGEGSIFTVSLPA